LICYVALLPEPSLPVLEEECSPAMVALERRALRSLLGQVPCTMPLTRKSPSNPNSRALVRFIDPADQPWFVLGREFATPKVAMPTVHVSSPATVAFERCSPGSFRSFRIVPVFHTLGSPLLDQMPLCKAWVFHELPSNPNLLGLVCFMKDQPWFAWVKLGLFSGNVFVPRPLAEGVPECGADHTAAPIESDSAVVRSGSWANLVSTLENCQTCSKRFLSRVPKQLCIEIPSNDRKPPSKGSKVGAGARHSAVRSALVVPAAEEWDKMRPRRMGVLHR
jgi:hypothetical protein